MTNWDKWRIRIWLACLTAALLSAAPLRPQGTVDAGLQMTTQERLETESWWPTMATAPLSAYAGSEACAKCHDEGRQSTAMRRAATPAAAAHVLQDGALSLEAAAFSYRLSASPQGLDLAVSNKDRRQSQRLAWVMGAGDLAQTFLYQRDGRWLQSEVSFYTRPAVLDITTGLGKSSGSALTEALGQPLSAEDARSCFNCHTVHATTSAGLDPLHAEPGLGCEACHGPAREHVARMSGQAKTPTSIAIFDPSTLSPSDSIDFCGSCHRSSADAKLSVTQTFSLSVVRFQPYRLEESKCWRATKDRRLTCVACHNPHQPLARDSLSYDKQCLRCHTGATANTAPAQQVRVCPRAATHCVSCHMPKVAIASMHGDFTDHYIRVVREGEPLPR